MSVEDTASFRAALESAPEQAEQWLNQVKANRVKFPQYDDRWIDHRERELFQAYCRTADWSAAKRVAEATSDPKSKEGRARRLQELSGIVYEQL